MLDEKDKGLILYLPFEEGYGNATLDWSGNDNSGTIYGASWTSGKIGKALYFDGIDDFVEVPVFPLTNKVTVSAWAYLIDGQPSGDWAGIIRSLNGLFNENRLLVRHNYILLQLKIGGTIYNHLAPAPYNLRNAWHHYVVVYDGSKVSIYLDGKRIYSREQTGNLDGGTAKPVIGWGSNYSSYYHFKGMIDEVRVYNRALSEEEIRELYYSALHKFYPVRSSHLRNFPGCVLYFNFEERSGNIAYDQSGFGNNGTIYGAAWSYGKIGRGLYFDGIDDYVRVENLTPSGALNSFPLTISAWIYYYPDSGRTYTYISNWAGSYTGWFIQKNVVNSFYIAVGTGSSFKVQGVVLNTEGWVHAAAVINGVGKAIEFYLNGKLVSSDILPSYYPGHDYLVIGAHPVRAMFSKGVMDEIRIYNRALSEKEIRAIYYQGLRTSKKNPIIDLIE